MRSEISFTWVRRKGRKGPQDPPNMKKSIFFHMLGSKLKNVLSDCFLIWHARSYGWEDIWKSKIGPVCSSNTHSGPPKKLVFKLFPLVVHMSPLWWGLHLLTFRCSCYPWILCKGPTWPRKKWNLFYFFHIFYFNSKGSYHIASIFDM